MPTITEINKIIKKLKEDKKKKLTEIENIDEKIEKAKRKIEEEKTGCQHDWEVIICELYENKEAESKTVDKYFPGLRDSFKISGDSLLAKSVDFGTMNEFFDNYSLGIKCKKCEFIKTYMLDMKAEISFQIKPKDKK